MTKQNAPTNRQAIERTAAADPGLQKRKKASRQYLTDRGLKALAPAKAGKRNEIWDTKIPGFGVRVGDAVDKTRPGKAGRIAFVLYSRFPGHAPSRRALGLYGAITLEQARAKAGEWLEAARKGKDPRAEEARQRQAALVAAKSAGEKTFAAAAEDFIREVVVGTDPAKPKQRKGRAVARDIRRTLVPVWAEIPIAEITRHEVRELIEQVRDLGTDGMLAKNGIKPVGGKRKTKPTPVQAARTLAYAKQLFGWALDRDDYGLAANPAADLKAKKIIGPKAPRNRILSDAELFAFWRAAERTPYPAGPVFKLLALTALRINEVARAHWAEFVLPNKIWVIPAERMKATNERARAHAVPLTDDILAILETLPRFKSGKYLFSTTLGKKPVSMNEKVRTRLQRKMLYTLRALARRRGDDPAGVNIPHWTAHDIRRTVRSGLSRLRIEEVVREAVLAHRRPGMAGVYDHHDYFDEKRAALDLWAARLRGIVHPPADNVVDLTKARG